MHIQLVTLSITFSGVASTATRFSTWWKMMYESCLVRLRTTSGTKFWRWRLQTTTYTCSCKQTRNTVQQRLLGSSSRTLVSTCWNGILRFESRISGVADSGRSDTTWERRERCRRKWLNGILRRQNTRPGVGLHPRPRWVGELALAGCLDSRISDY